MNHTPRKRFGQNFLHDMRVIQRIVSSIAPKENEPVLEIGPGQGALTAIILPHNPQLTAVELDRDLAAMLRLKFAENKNFSLIETSLGDFRLSPAYDLLNSRIHILDRDFALEEGLLPPQEASGRITQQFMKLGELAGISEKQLMKTFDMLTNNEEEVKKLIDHSFLSERFKRNYEQAYLTRLAKLTRP